MTQQKHAPGPWSFTVWGGAAPQEDHGKPARLCVDDEDGVTVCQIAWFDPYDHGELPLEEQLANAHLLGAAPDLYAALRDLLDHVTRHWLLSPSHRLHVAATAALAKADGREAAEGAPCEKCESKEHEADDCPWDDYGPVDAADEADGRQVQP